MMFERSSLRFGDDVRYALGEPMQECPKCGSEEMRAVKSVGEIVNYLCDGCGRCWSLDWIGVRRVDPVHCPGCPDRDHCFDRLRQEIPAWGWWSIDA